MHSTYCAETSGIYQTAIAEGYFNHNVCQKHVCVQVVLTLIMQSNLMCNTVHCKLTTLMHKFPSPITEVISSNEESEQLPVIVHVDFTILN